MRNADIATEALTSTPMVWGETRVTDQNLASASILLLPPHKFWPAWTGASPVDDEDRERPYRLLAERGFTYARRELNSFPVNPGARARPVYCAIDPFRAISLMWMDRDAKFVVCFFESSALAILLLRRVFRFKAKVIVVDLGMPGWRPRRFLLNLVVPRADAVLPYSTAHAEMIRKTWPKARLVYPVYAQVDTDFYNEAEDQPDGPVLAVGDDQSRDYATLLSIAPAVGHPIVIRSRLVSPGLHPFNVHIMPHAIPLPAYRDLLATASVVVLPLHPVVNGGGTSALVQAMASGKAIVVTASPGVLDYVVDGETALVVPCYDPKAMQAAITRLLTDHAFRRKLGAAGRQRALQVNSYEAWADTIETVADLLSPASSAHGFGADAIAPDGVAAGLVAR